MNLEKLKETARRFEQKEEWKKAIDVYLKAIAEVESGRDSHPDLAVYNRLGDLYLKTNDNVAAIRAYERAAELYAEQGFFNNAIALCGKILRLNPQRSPIYLRLAALHARKNVVIEAKRNLLEYMGKMHAVGQLDEAFAAVRQSADEFSGNQELRLMLVDLLKAASREDEARDELQKVASVLESRGEATAAAGLRSQLVEIDVDFSAPLHDDAVEPTVPRAPVPVVVAPPTPKSGDLVFLDMSAYDGEPEHDFDALATASTDLPLLTADPLDTDRGAVKLGSVLPTGQVPPNVPIDGRSIMDEAFDGMRVQPLDGIETTHEAPERPTADAAMLDGLEVAASLTSIDVEADLVDGIERHDQLAADEPPVLQVEGFESDVAEPLAAEAEQIDALVVDADIVLDDEPSTPTDADSMLQIGADALDDGGDPTIEELDAEVVTAIDLDSTSELEAATEPGSTAPEPAVLADPDAHELIDLDELPADLDAGNGDSETAPSAGEVLEMEVPEPAPIEPVAVAATLRTLIESLEDRIADDPGEPSLHHRLADALLDAGDIERALEELAHALLGYESSGQFEAAWALADRLVGMQPDTIRFHQKRVEVAFRLDDRPRLIEAYLALGDSLIRADAVDKALAVYRRVLDHDPANRQAHGALEAYSPRPPVPSPPATPPARPVAPLSGPVLSSAVAEDGFIDLGSLILEPEPTRDTRMTTAIQPPTGDEDRDFEEALAAFKRGIEENLEDTDYEAHYDLGVAFKEMGLLDEAIAEFQKALRAPDGRLRTSEALGQAFLEKGQTAIAEAVLRRAVESLEGADDLKVGVLYWLGRSAELQGRTQEAVAAYERALAVDIRFADVSERLARLGAGRAS